MAKKFLLPFAVFIIVAVFLGYGLGRDPGKIPSPLIDKPAPQFSLPVLLGNGSTISTGDMMGKVWLFNVWASWCVACLDEHPLLLEVSQQFDFPLVGLNYEDQSQDALKWLEKYGNPYDIIAVDRDGNTGIDYGVYGVPETFAIDSKGIIRYKVIGAITRKELENELLPTLKELLGKTD